MRKVHTDHLQEWVGTLHAGESVLLSGTVYTARDAVHKRLKALIEEGKPLPFELDGSVIYYAGPTPAKDGLPIGSCGPTTSSRMDPYMELLSAHGLKLTIGKGDRSPQVYQALRSCGGAYLCAIGGAGALCAASVKAAEVVAFPELGCESVKKLTVEDFPLFVAIDADGHSIFPHTDE